MLCLSFGLWIIGDLLPPPAPDMTAEQITEFYQVNNASIRVGLALCIFGAGFLLPPLVALKEWLIEKDPNNRLLANIQLASGIGFMPLAMMPFLIWMTAAYRPDRSPELILLLNDLGWIMFSTVVSPVIIPILAVCFIVLKSESLQAEIPRWAAYLGIWQAMGAITATLTPFVYSGPFAWNGILGFWLPIVIFLIWISAIFIHLLIIGSKQ